jgi:hypothetical protein
MKGIDLDSLTEKLWVDPKIQPSKRFWPGDVTVLKDPETSKRLERLMANSKYKLDVYFLDKTIGWDEKRTKQGEYVGQGYERERYFLSRRAAKSLGIPVDTKFRIFSKREDADNLIAVICDNTADDGIQLSPWMIIHRSVHAFLDHTAIYKSIGKEEVRYENICRDLYGVDGNDARYLVRMFEKILTMGSARKGKIRYYHDEKYYDAEKYIFGHTHLSSSGDWITEMVVQSITTGLKLNPFPQSIEPPESKTITKTKKVTVPGKLWGTREIDQDYKETIPLKPGVAKPEKLAHYNSILRTLESDFDNAVAKALSMCKGKIAVLDVS